MTKTTGANEAPEVWAYELPPSAKSYLYVRVSILVVIAALAVSVMQTRYRGGVVLGSLSAYYYTPVHSLFVGALVALGVVMIALRSSDDLEDMLLNVAGAVAPIVAFVPTTPPDSTDLSVTVETDALIRNNVVSLLVAMAIALGVSVVLTARRDEQRAMVPRARSTVVGLIVSGVLLAALIGWYWLARQQFLQRAHGASAIVMFVLIIAAVLVNANWPPGLIVAVRRWLDISSVPTPSQHRFYLAVAAWMVFGAALAAAIGGASRVFWVEVVEIVGFVAFWTVQTVSPPPSSPLCHHHH